MGISLRVTEQENKAIKEIATFYNMTVSDFIRQTIQERLEDEFDIQLARVAMKRLKKDEKTYTTEEIAKEFGIEL